MHFLINVCVWAVAAAAIGAAPDSKRSDPLLVRAVIDGDTIDVALYGRVRLLGIDAPEVGRVFDTSAPFGREARDRLAQIVLHRWVRLEQDTPALDTYNRHLAYVLTETGEFVNATLVRDGRSRRGPGAHARRSRGPGVSPRHVGHGAADPDGRVYSPVGRRPAHRRPVESEIEEGRRRAKPCAKKEGRQAEGGILMS